MAIRYDNFVKRPLAQGEYTPDMVVELQKCSEDIWHFLKYVKIVHPDKGRIAFKPYTYQKDILKLLAENRFVVGLWARQSGKTTVMCAYAIWYAIFNPDKTIGIVSNKLASAIDILARLKLIYEELPMWMKPGVSEYAKTGVIFDNNTRIMVSATSPDAFRGRTLNLLIMDEFAFVPREKADEFWAANQPTIAASQEARVVIISTPNGMFNLFHRLYTSAERQENTFIPIKTKWDQVPGRDAKWAREQKANLGKMRFMQEHEVQFLGSTNTVIEADKLEELYRKIEEPIHIDLQGKLKIYEKPVANCMYVLGVDTSKGTGENSSVIQILKVTSIKPAMFQQVGIFCDSHTDVYSFAEIVNRISLYYYNAWIMCENNAEGSTIVSRLWWEYENPGLVNSGSKTIDLGIRAHRHNKPKAIMLMKKLIEDDECIIVDKDTVDELSSFIEENGKFFGKDMPDDRVSALYWAVYIALKDILEESFTIQTKDVDDDAWGILSDYTVAEEDFSWVTNLQ